MSNDNPYAVSETLSGGAPFIATDSRFYVEGDQITFFNHTDLPEICVVTGDQEDLVRVRKTLIWVPSWIYLLLLINLLVLLIVYLIVRKKCTVSYAMSRSARNAGRMRTLTGVLTMIGGGIAGVLIVSGNRPEIGLVIGIVAFLVGLVLLYAGGLPISIAKHKDGRQFWLKGFKPAFFDSLRQMYDAGGF